MKPPAKRKHKMKLTTQPAGNKIISVTATYTWKIRQHGGWKTLVQERCDSREEFNQAVDKLAVKAAGRHPNSPAIFSADDYADCGYYKPALEAGTVACVCFGKNNVEQFTDAAAADRRHDEAMRDFGHGILLADIGGHACNNNIVDVTDIVVLLQVSGSHVSFKADSADHVFTAQDIEDEIGQEGDPARADTFGAVTNAEILDLINVALRSFKA